MDKAYDEKNMSFKDQMAAAKAGYRAKRAKAKAEYEKKKAEIKSAKTISYTSGVIDYKDLPKRKEALRTAKKSYSEAINDSTKIDKLKDKQRQKMAH